MSNTGYTNADWKLQAQANAAALNNLYEFIGTQVGPIPMQWEMEECATDPVVLVGHMIATIQERLAAIQADARIAELQAERDENANQLDSARHTVDVLTARIATARNEALEEAATIVYNSDIEAPEPVRPFDTWGDMVADTPERHADLSEDHARWVLSNAIRALKTPEGDG